MPGFDLLLVWGSGRDLEDVGTQCFIFQSLLMVAYYVMLLSGSIVVSTS